MLVRPVNDCVTQSYAFQDGRLSIIRLEQLLKEKITTNTTFKVKTANASVRKATSDSGGVSGSQQLEDDVEVKETDAQAEDEIVVVLPRMRTPSFKSLRSIPS